MTDSTTALDAADGPHDDSRDDRALLLAHVEGESEAFGVLFGRHRDRLWTVAMRTMGNREDAADGLQDGMIAAYRRAATFRGDAAVSTWLHRVVVNACLDRLRAAKVRRADALPDDLEEASARGDLVSDATRQTDPLRAAIDGERRARILDALATLPHEQRAALVLVDMEGYSVAEAAAILDCAAGTVKSRCSRGRTRLAALLRDLLDPGLGPPAGAPRNPPSPRRVQAPEAPRAPPAPADPPAPNP